MCYGRTLIPLDSVVAEQTGALRDILLRRPLIIQVVNYRLKCMESRYSTSRLSYNYQQYFDLISVDKFTTPQGPGVVPIYSRLFSPYSFQ